MRTLHVGDRGYFLSTRLNVSLPGIAREVAQALVDEADQPARTQRRRAAISMLRINLV
jgi:hypothetical protein